MYTADVFVEKVSNLSKIKDEAQILSSMKDLCEQQFVLVRNVREAAAIGPAYENLVSLTQQKFGLHHRLALLAKIQLVWNYNFQGRREDAASLSEHILPAMRQEFGENSHEVFSLMRNLVVLYKNLGRVAEAEILDQAQLEKHRHAYPLCEHLKPIEDYLLSQSVKFGSRDRNKHDGTVEVDVNAWLNCDSIREKLQLNPCVEKLERYDYKSNSIRGFLCSIHKHSIYGFYEPYPEWPVIE